MTTNIDLQSWVKKISAMLATADSLQETNPEAAANYRAKAEELARAYRVEEEQLIAADAAAAEPEFTEVTVLLDAWGGFSQHYYSMVRRAAEYAGVRVHLYYRDNGVVAGMVGYPGDLRLAEMLFNSARKVFQEKLQPEVKPELGDQVNAYRLRQAGIERNRIAQILWGASLGSDGQVAHRKVAKLYKAECEARGINPQIQGRSIKAKDYREAYADRFISEFRTMLREAKDAADSVGGSLVLHGRQERVDEAFWTRFPEQRPSQAPARVEEDKPCEACAKTTSKTGKCKAHRPLTWTKADEARWQRKHYGASALAGAKAGRAAAREVEVATPERAQRLPEGEGTSLMREIKSW